MKHIISVLIIVLLVSSCTSIAEIQRGKIDSFWQWFENNKNQFSHITDANRDKKLDTILNHLKPIKEGLAVEVSDEFKGVRDIVISGNGDIDNFSAVKAIVKQAPKIKGWTVTAFRQRATGDFTVKYNDLSFTPSKMFFYPEVNKDSLKIDVYVAGIKNHDYKEVSYYGLIAMDDVLGEYDSVTKVDQYSFHDLDSATNKEQLKPVSQLPAFVDAYRKR